MLSGLSAEFCTRRYKRFAGDGLSRGIEDNISDMTDDDRFDILDLFRETGGYLQGHFLLTSGRHSAGFLRAAALSQYPHKMSMACKALAELFAGEQLDVVIGPAVGGITVAYEVARELHVRMAFSEQQDGGMAVLRGFKLAPGERALVVDDVMTTGGSIRKTVDHLRSRDVTVVGVGVFVDRSGGTVRFDVPVRSLATIEIETYDPAACPLCDGDAPLSDPDETPG